MPGGKRETARDPLKVGEDAVAAVEALVALIADGFHEMHLTGDETGDEADAEEGTA